MSDNLTVGANGAREPRLAVSLALTLAVTIGGVAVTWGAMSAQVAGLEGRLAATEAQARNQSETQTRILTTLEGMKTDILWIRGSIGRRSEITAP